MESKDYLRLAQRTNHTLESREHAKARIMSDEDYDLNHSIIGMITEVGEFADVHKKWINYGKKEDLVNMAEELGDLLWYISLAINAMNEKGLDVSFESIMETNIEKLAARYPEKFTAYLAINRDLDAERKILERDQ